MNDQEEKEYQKGFNQGYILAKHVAVLSSQLAKHIKDTSHSKRGQGFGDGTKKYRKTIEQERQDDLKLIRDKRGDRSQERGI
ncbi:hypothetical protein COB64_03975 [Candidatus Wolfebacteria bacterium]|nr:MAG: hypothetical protein COB64_03975 [Candidatus Wolfebacteria bacterium]